jgi:hypothetical protein
MCGAPDGCGGLCNGVCPSGQHCMSGACIPDVCDPPCGCGMTCVRGTCAPLCNATQTLCGCNNCCAATELCDRGMCRPPG